MDDNISSLEIGDTHRRGERTHEGVFLLPAREASLPGEYNSFFGAQLKGGGQMGDGKFLQMNENAVTLPLTFLTQRQIFMIDEALSALGEYGELRLIVEKGRLRFLVTQRSIDALKWQPGMFLE